MAKEPSKLQLLHAHRKVLENRAAEEKRSGHEESYQLTQLLLKQCEFLIENAEREENSGGP
jgi:hypothetical protein